MCKYQCWLRHVGRIQEPSRIGRIASSSTEHYATSGRLSCVVNKQCDYLRYRGRVILLRDDLCLASWSLLLGIYAAPAHSAKRSRMALRCACENSKRVGWEVCVLAPTLTWEVTVVKAPTSTAAGGRARQHGCIDVDRVRCARGGAENSRPARTVARGARDLATPNRRARVHNCTRRRPSRQSWREPASSRNCTTSSASPARSLQCTQRYTTHMYTLLAMDTYRSAFDSTAAPNDAMLRQLCLQVHLRSSSREQACGRHELDVRARF